MKTAIYRTTTAMAAFATAGVSSIFLGASPAMAATDACGAVGTLIAPGVCEQVYTSGIATFTPTAGMTKLEVLLVGAGGAGAEQTATVPSTTGYAAGGGGGEVKIVDFSGATAPMNLTVAEAGVPGTITDGTTTGTAANGLDAFANSQDGGASGSGKAGASGDNDEFPFGAGGGAGASPVANADGGAGIVVSSIAPSGSLFTGDSNCYGGGGAVGILDVQGIPGCGGGGPADTTGTTLLAPVANSGGGGGGLNVTQTPEARAGAAGLIAIRWTAANVTVAFDVKGHGTAPAAQTFAAGNTAVAPANPTADGVEFKGWFSDVLLTTPADFSAAVTTSTTFFAKWEPILAATGFEPNAAVLPFGALALVAGASLFVFSRRRKRSAD